MTIRLCSKCGTPLASDAPAGVCPQCVLQLGLESEVHVSVVEAQSPSASPESRPTPSVGIDPGPTAAGGGGFTPPTVEELQPHFPQLKILELLGRGGMGAVYKARQEALDRHVALKILPPEVGRDPQFAERFAREARALAKLSHPNIVMVYDFGQSDGLYYLLMEYVDGVNLRQVIHGGTMQPEDALKIVPQICEALQFAHEEGVVHRDIKPENILLDKKGRLKIADFGLAKLLGRADSAVLLTQTFQVMGTLHYMAPEQFERPTAVDHRADLYSLGVVFYELLTGQLPLGRYALPSEKAPIDARLDNVVLKTLEREPERRYQHASEIKTDLENISQGGPASRPQTFLQAPKSSAPLPGARELTAAEWEDARRKVRAPAVALMLAGMLNLAPCLLGALLLPRYFFLQVGSLEIADPRSDVRVAAAWQAVFPAGAGLWPGGFCQLALAWQEALPGWREQTAPRMSMEMTAFSSLLLPFALLSLPLGILMILGGYKMKRLELYGLAVVAACAALAPCAPGFLISLPIGIWALLVLWNPEVKAAFGAKPVLAEVVPEKKPPPGAHAPAIPGDAGRFSMDPADENALALTRGATMGPGSALVFVGALSAIFSIGIFVFSAFAEFSPSTTTAGSGQPARTESLVTLSLLSAAALGVSMLILAGGLRMRERTGYGWALAASLLAMAPVAPTCLLGFWVGLWSFFTLQSSAVKRAFAAQARRAAPARLFTTLALVIAPPALLLAAGTGMLMLSRAGRLEPVGTIMVYEVQMSNQYTDGPSGRSQEVLAFCEARVNCGQRKLALVQFHNPTNPAYWERRGTLVEIGVYGKDPVVANRIEERLAAQGKIEFAILADAETDRALIARAQNAGAEVLPENAQPAPGERLPPPVGRWVKIAHRAERQLQDPFGEYGEFATRRSQDGGLEILVLVDPLNVTEKELSLARVDGPTAMDRADVTLAFNSEGARRMRALTSRPENVSTSFKTRRMGIIVDDALLDAVHIRHVLADQMEIKGEFTPDEAHDFVSLVRAGPPPALINQLSRKAVE